MSRLTKSALGNAANTAGLDTPLAGQFSRAIRLSFATGNEAEGAFIAAGAVLNTRFQSRDVNALDSSAPEVASLSSPGGNLVLSLPVARKIRTVRLDDPQAGDKILAFRFDGDVVSDDPVETATHRSNGARLDVTDASLILRRKNGAEFPLTTSEIAQINLRYTPSNPRLMLRSALDPHLTVPLETQTDADGLPEFPNTGTYGDAFATALQVILDGLPSPLPDPIEVDLVLVADSPCTARLDAFDVTLVLEKSGLSQKSLLRFSGGAEQQKVVTLDLPSGGQMQSGAALFTVSGTAPRPQQQTTPLSPMPATTGDGIRLSEVQPIATQKSIDPAQTITGAAFVLAAPEGPVELRAVLYADADGSPGAAIAESDPQTIDRATPVAVAFSFAPVAIPVGLLWVGVMALKGTSVAMLGGSAPLAQASGEAFSLLNTAPGLAATLTPAAVTAATTPAGPVLYIDPASPILLPTTGTTEIDMTPFASALTDTPHLVVTSTSRAIVTIDPPRLRYTLS